MKQLLPLPAILMFFLSMQAVAGGKRASTYTPACNFTTVGAMSSYMFAANGNIADGNRVIFGSQYSNLVDIDDSWKMTNPGENFGLLRDGQTLAVECRQPVQSGDTLFYKTTHFACQVYKMMLIPQNLSNLELKAELLDSYLNTTTTISLTDTTRLNVTYTTDAASMASDRLKLVFTSKVLLLPISFKGIDAFRNPDNSVTVTCKTTNETGIKSFTAESSFDGQHFTTVSNWQAKNNPAVDAEYSTLDRNATSKESFYRVKAIQKSGEVLLTSIVRVAAANHINAGMELTGNPVIGRVMKLTFQNQPEGQYNLVLVDMSGRIVQSEYITLHSGRESKVVLLKSSVQNGLHQLTLQRNSKAVTTLPLLVR